MEFIVYSIINIARSIFVFNYLEKICLVIIETKVTRVIPGGCFKSFRTASLTMLLLVQSFGALLRTFYVANCTSVVSVRKYFYFNCLNASEAGDLRKQ